MKRLYRYIAITSLFYLISFLGVSIWFWDHISDANVSAAYFVFEPNMVDEEPFEPYIRRDGTYGQVSEFFQFRESNLYNRVRQTRKAEIYRSKHANYEGRRIYTYCKPFYKNGEFAGVFCIDVPIRTWWLLAISVIACLGIVILLLCVRRIYKDVRQMAIKDTQREEQIKLAAELQQQILPAVLPEHPSLELSALYKPAQNVGGDLYDIRLENNDILTFCIGDISGHGMPAALLMSQVAGIFRSTHGSPAEIMKALNIVLSDNNPNMQFCTMFIGQLNLSNGTLVFCNAGHPVPEIKALATGDILNSHFSILNSPVLPPLGIDSSVEYSEHTFILPMGVTLALFTDGVYEDEDDDISRLNITWKAKLENLHPWLLAQGIENNMTELALEEALVNVLKYSTASAVSLLPFNPQNDNQSDCTPSSEQNSSFVLLDNGMPFDPVTAVSLSDGVGLNLIREIASPVYERQNGINCLTMSFGNKQ